MEIEPRLGRIRSRSKLVNKSQQSIDSGFNQGLSLVGGAKRGLTSHTRRRKAAPPVLAQVNAGSTPQVHLEVFPLLEQHFVGDQVGSDAAGIQILHNRSFEFTGVRGASRLDRAQNVVHFVHE